MSRGGRGGGRGGRGGMHRNPLPFDVDQDIVDNAQVAGTGDNDDEAKQLFPPIELVAPAPPTAEQIALVKSRRERIAKFQASVWYTGGPEEFEAMKKGGKDKNKRPADAFDSMETYSKKKRAKPDDFVPLHKRVFPKQHPDTPAELRFDVSTKKKPAAKKSVTDRLANIKDGKEEEGDDDDESVEGAKDDEDAASELQDSEFSEDEADDADNDYNAENYFSGGEDDGSVGGGDDGGDEGY